MNRIATATLLFALLSGAPAAASVSVKPAPAARPAGPELPIHVGGRAQRQEGAAGPAFVRQWPGSYFETAFTGSGAYLKVGPGAVILHILVDGEPAVPMVKPAPGFYRINGLAAGSHKLRAEIVTEGQAGPSTFGGFYPSAGSTPLPVATRGRQIEFIGDSYTVGYGNTSPKHGCTADDIWATTDTSQAAGPITAKRFGADYQVNAISGRGVVRNYGGFVADPLPAVYPFILFDKAARYRDSAWRPQIIVVGLGTNDFSTPLHATERWRTRDALHADFEASYVRFVQDLLSRSPGAYVILWATDGANGEIESEVRKVVDRLHVLGAARVGFIPIHGLSFTACDYHPSTADDRLISDALSKFIQAHPELWRGQ